MLFWDFLKIKHLFRSTPANNSFQCSDLLQKSKIIPTAISNQGSNKNDFNDFKTDFSVQESDFTQKSCKNGENSFSSIN